MRSMTNRKAAVLLESLYEDPEFWYPYLRLKEAGAKVEAVAPEKGVYQSKHGYPATAEVASAAAAAKRYDLVVIPGGYSPDRMRRDENMVEVVRRTGEGGRLVAAICHGGWMLVSSGLAAGRRLTSFFSIKDDLIAAGADWVDEPVVRDGNVITAQVPKDLPEFMAAILAALDEKTTS